MIPFCFTRMPAKTLKQRGFVETVPHWQSPARGHWLSPLRTCSVPGSQPWSPRGLLARSVPGPWTPWDLQVWCNHPASSTRPRLHPCTQGTSNILAGFQKESKTWTQQCWNHLLNTHAFFLPSSLLNRGVEEQGSRLWTNTPLAAALEIAWQWLGVIGWDAPRKSGGKFWVWVMDSAGT